LRLGPKFNFTVKIDPLAWAIFIPKVVQNFKEMIMANFTHAIMIVITISALAAVWRLNQNRAEDSARGGPRRGRLRSGLFAVESLAQEVRLGGVISPTSSN
jgi:hypothetical protein